MENVRRRPADRDRGRDLAEEFSARREDPRRPARLAREGAGHLEDHHLERMARARQGGRLRPRRARLPSRRRRFGSRQYGAGMVLRRPRGALRRRRLLRNLSDRFGQAGRLPGQRFTHPRAVRRGRRAARQGAGGARSLPDARAHRDLRHGRAGEVFRPDVRLLRLVPGRRPRAHGRRARTAGRR